MRNTKLLKFGVGFLSCFAQYTLHCSGRTAPSPDYPSGRQTVRTTAFSDAHRAAAKNAKGARLRSGQVKSAAADWSRFPLGTKFRVLPTNQTYVVDDYGPALVGTNTIDLYMSSRQEMARWGVRQVTIDIIEAGSYEKSLSLLKARKKTPYVRQMVTGLRKKVQ